MGNVKVIQGTYGFCSVIIDSQFCTWVEQHGFNDTQAYTGGQITQFGNELINELNAYHGNLKYTLLHNLTIREYDASALIHLLNIFGLDITYSEAFFRETITELFNTSTQSSYVKITPDDTDLVMSMSNDNADFWTSSWSAVPYGHLRDRTSYVNLRLVIPVFNDDMTSGYSLFFSIASDVRNVTYHAYRENQTYFSKFSIWLNGIPEWKDNADPYTPGGTTEPGGGKGDHDDDSDDIPISDLPTLSASDTRFMTLYNPNLAQVNSLASWMWDPSVFDVNDLKKLFQSPMQAILGLTIVPVSPVIYDTPSQIWVGNIASPVTANKVATQYKRKPMGYVDIPEYWGSYLDYSPYTRIEIYLPYIGTRQINTDDVMGKRVTCVYNIDVVTGACVAQLQCGDSVLYQFSGNCASSVPITGGDWSNVINSALSVAISGATLAASAAVGAAPTAAAAVAAVGSIAQNVVSAKPTILKSGGLSGGAGFLSGQTPYFIITRPRQAVPEEQNKYTGYPSWITETLGNLSGLTYVAECHLEGIPCTTAEQDEIMSLLKGGVIL